MAREYGIPGVVGTREATERIRDGTRIRVDGDTGEVTVLAMKRRPSSRSARRATPPCTAPRPWAWAMPCAQGLAVPPGVALSGDLVEAVAAGDTRAIARLAKAIAPLAPPFAVRSSAVDEDGAAASFAGQHLTVLNVHAAADVPQAVREVWWSANSDAAITYRQRVGLFTRPSVGVIVQTLLDPRGGRRHVHREPDHRRRRTRHRSQLGPGRSRRRPAW